MNEIETLAFNLNQKITNEIQQTLEHKALMLFEFSLEFSKYQSGLFPIYANNAVFNYSIPKFQPLINLININANPLSQKDNDKEGNRVNGGSQKENQFLNKKRFTTETNPIIRSIKKQTVKNNKVVFCHSDTLYTPIKKGKKKKEPPISSIITINTANSNQSDDSATTNSALLKSRGSIYRGVSRNGNQWQVLIMINKKKLYIGSYSIEEQAAKAYDVVALRHHGKKAKTNFYYTSQEIEEII